MILRPVSPVSPCGPPTTKRPVGLMSILVFFVIRWAGSVGRTISSMQKPLIVRWLAFAACCVEITTLVISTG